MTKDHELANEVGIGLFTCFMDHRLDLLESEPEDVMPWLSAMLPASPRFGQVGSLSLVADQDFGNPQCCERRSMWGQIHARLQPLFLGVVAFTVLCGSMLCFHVSGRFWEDWMRGYRADVVNRRDDFSVDFGPDGNASDSREAITKSFDRRFLNQRQDGI